MKLHWIWRASVAVSAGAILVGSTALSVFIPTPEAIRRWMEATSGLSFSADFALSATIVLIPYMSVPAAVYGVLTHYYGPEPLRNKETRCRKCGYILRGIPEPRCSECGERV